MPALGMAQDTGILVRWLKHEGDPVAKGDLIMEIETDKATVEIEAPATGILGGIRAREGDVVPVGETVAWILEPGESMPEETTEIQLSRAADSGTEKVMPPASPVARRIAEEHGVDLALVKPDAGRIQKTHVLAYLEQQKSQAGDTRLTPASPKARRLARERGLHVASLTGTGPEGAVLAADVLATEAMPHTPQSLALSTTWHLMAERVTQSWRSAPHFYLLREVNAARFITWRALAQEQTEQSLTYTDLLVKLLALTLRQHPRINAAWSEGEIVLNSGINVGLAVAVEAGLVVPVIHRAHELSLSQIAERRHELVGRAQAGKLRPEDLRNGTFTISNLGMYGVDAFNPIVNPPQAAILGVGRIAQRVVPVNGQPAVQPMMMLSLSCDHRVIDGVRGAQFLETLVSLIEEPLRLLD
jgi:pyruvate dehydrogenase E2 component (dihydrolipoamide acetyltransferase)